jgi:hypothetical protein
MLTLYLIVKNSKFPTIREEGKGIPCPLIFTIALEVWLMQEDK